MNVTAPTLLAASLLGTLGVAPLAAQVLHVDDRWEECAIVLDPSLTQDAWRRFVREMGLVAFFRPLASARPMGTRKVEVGILNWSTRVDPTADAWNDTFVHPDSTHWLFEGDALPIPGLSARAGITDRLDVGAYFTRSIGSNYGLAGAQLQYNLLDDPQRRLAAAARASFVTLFGPEDLGVSVYGLEFLVSRDLSALSPYAAVSGYLARGSEHTAKVDLNSESALGVRGTLGLAVSVWVLRLGAEVNLAEVSGYSFKIAFGT
jgi:hypothetical protein